MGSGFKDWAAGDVLTAADVDGYLMRQTAMTFADASARDTALSGVLDEGMVAYLEDTDRFTFYTGSAWVDIAQIPAGPTAAYPWSAGDVITAADLNAYAGLVYITGGTVSGSTTLSVDNCFTSQFVNYRIVFGGMSTSVVSRAFRLRLRASGTDDTSSNFDYAFRGIRASGVAADTNLVGASFTEIGVFLDTATNVQLGSCSMDVYGPAVADRTFATINAIGHETNMFTRSGGFTHFANTAYDGFTIYLNSTGNIQFNWRVYGYNDG